MTNSRQGGCRGCRSALNAVVWGSPSSHAKRKPADAPAGQDWLRFRHLVCVDPHVPLPKLQTDYNEVRDATRVLERGERSSACLLPERDDGWDSSPRAHQDDEFGNFGYPFTNTIAQHAARFKEALELTKRRLLSKPADRAS